ncbi:MAG: hypothetical protein J1F33_00990 [Clostridiales bacterium]|nr:hypothetical protein [Clostridiales bacterium]
MATDKFMSMLGFAKRARKIVYGLDSLETAKHIKLLALSDTASENLTKAIVRLSQRKNLPLITVEKLEDKAGGNCKALGITDENMALEMIKYVKGGAQGYKI